MIVTVTLNPCYDKTQIVEHFIHGGTNRVIESRQDFGGKGINVSIALAGLGVPSVCTGFGFERDAAHLSQNLRGLGIRDDFVVCPGNMRVNTKIFERDTGVMTEINEKGNAVSGEQFEALKSKVSEYGGQADMFIFSGSAPRGIDGECYAELITAARKNNPNVKVILDAEGPLLTNALKARPDIIKPNLFELESILEVSITNTEQIVSKCRELMERNRIDMICVSMGDKGAVITGAEHAYYAPPLPLTVRGLQGAGDSMVAGICLSVMEGRPLDEVLRCAVAAASASIEREGTLLCTKDDFERIYEIVDIKYQT